MGLFSIALASFLVSHTDQRDSGNLEDPEKARSEVEPTGDDNESIQDSDQRDDEPDEHEPPTPERRVTFDAPSGASTPSSEKVSDEPGLLARLKAAIFPAQGEEKHHRILPVISGLVIPFCILLEIPGLTDRWYIRTDQNVVVESRPDPTSIRVMLAISMFSAVVANVSLICRFLEKGPVLATTLTTIASLTIHDLINIVVVVTFGIQHRFADGFTYGHGYWMTVCSTSVSTVTNVSLIWDLVWTRNFTQSGSGVSRKQRSLLIIVILLLVYIAFGALVNSFLIKLNFIDGLYFTVVSIETVGFGDITPDNTGSRVFMCFYIIIGVLNLGVAVGVARETIFEQLQNSYQKRLARIRKKYQEHRNWRTWERKWKRAVEWRLREINADIWMPDHADDSESTMDVTREGPKRMILQFIGRIFHKHHEHNRYFRDEGEIQGVAYGHPGTHLNVETLSRAQLEAAAVESGVPLCVVRALRRRRAYLSRTHTITSQSSASTTQYWRRWFWSEHEPLPTERPTTPFMRGLEDVSSMLTKFAIATTGAGMNRMPLWTNTVNRGFQQRTFTLESTISDNTTLTSLPRPVIRDDFEEIASREEKKAFWAKLVVAWSLFMVFWFVGAVLFSATEGWEFGVAVYFCFVTFTTTGYGDYSPKSASGRSVFVFWGLLGLATMTIMVSVLQDAFSSKYRSAVHSGVFKNAVKKYHQKSKSRGKRRAKPEVQEELEIPVGARPSAIEESSVRAQRSLESLPAKVLERTRVFHQYIHYLTQTGHEGLVSTDPDPMLNDITRTQRLDETTKGEVLQDEDAENTLRMLSIEKALRELIDVAEGVQAAVAERDLVAVGYKEQQQVTEWDGHGGYPSRSGSCNYGHGPRESDTS